MSTELLPNVRSRFCDANNQPLAGGKLYTYEAGTSTPLATYVDQAAVTPNTNPIVLDANGEAVIFITSGIQYKFRLEDANGNILWTQDNVSGVGFSGNIGTGDMVGPTGSVNNEMALFSGTTGKVLKRASGTGFLKAVAGVISYVTGLDISTDTTGVLPLNRGGTGQTTANAALNVLLPDQTGNSGKVLKTDGTSANWQTETPAYITSIDTAIGSTPASAGMSVSSGKLTLQPADATHGGVLSILAQAIAGVKTFLDQLIRSSATGITAFAGGGQASATQLSKDINRVTTVATAGDSVKLPAGVAGMEVFVANDGANSLNVFPATGEQIDSLAANAAYALSTTLKNVRFICVSNGVWKTAAGGAASPLTTKGDLYVRNSSADTRLAVGTDGQALVADSAQASGLKWAAVGDAVGPAASVDSEIALFSGTTGKLLKRAAGTGFVKAASGVISYVTSIVLSTDVSGTLPIANGGTGQTTQQAAIDALLPSQTSNSGKFLTTNGTTSSWASVPTNAPSTFGSMGSPRSVVAATGITTGASHMSNSAITQDVFVVGSVANTVCDITANPQIEAGTVVGMEMCIHGTSDSAPVQFDDGTGLKLNGTRVVYNNDMLTIRWDGTQWKEKAWNGI